MVMEILTGSGVILSYLQDILRGGGGFCPRQRKRAGGDSVRWDFVLHSDRSVNEEITKGIN